MGVRFIDSVVVRKINKCVGMTVKSKKPFRVFFFYVCKVSKRLRKSFLGKFKCGRVNVYYIFISIKYGCILPILFIFYLNTFSLIKVCCQFYFFFSLSDIDCYNLFIANNFFRILIKKQRWCCWCCRFYLWKFCYYAALIDPIRQFKHTGGSYL